MYFLAHFFVCHGKKYKLNLTHRKQFPDRKLCLISTEDVGKLQPTPRRLYFNKFAKLDMW